MTNEIIITLLGTSLFWIIIGLLLTIRKKDKSRVEYDKGYNDGKSNSSFTLQVEPYEHISGHKGWFRNTQVLEIGYVYTLLVKGFPSLTPHIHILKRIKSSEVNEENIKLAMEKLDNFIDKVPSPHLKVVGSVKDFGSHLMKSFRKD